MEGETLPPRKTCVFQKETIKRKEMMSSNYAQH